MHKINYTSIVTQDIDDVNFIYTIYSSICLYIHNIQYYTLLSMINSMVSPRKSLHVCWTLRALVAVVLYSVLQPFNFFGSPDYLHSHLLLPTIIISQKARFITFILWNSFLSCIISPIYGYNQSHIDIYGIYNYYIP